MAELFLDLTVIIPNYNTRELLSACLASIYRHTAGITFEVICLDDASSDRSADMVAASFPEVILVRNQTNQYYSRNNNTGLCMSRGRYACLLNSDTLLTSNAFAALVAFMDAHPDAAACGPKLLNPDGSVQHCVRGFAGVSTFLLQMIQWQRFFPNSRIMNRYYKTDLDYSREQVVESIGTTAYVLRRSTWEQVGMLDERFRLSMVDLAYNAMLRSKGCKVYYTPCAEVVHFGSQSINQSALTSLQNQRDSFLQFSESYDYFGKGRLIKSVVRAGVWLRYGLKWVEFHLSSDKRIIKGPGAPALVRSPNATSTRLHLLPGKNSPTESRHQASVASSKAEKSTAGAFSSSERKDGRSAI